MRENLRDPWLWVNAIAMVCVLLMLSPAFAEEPSAKVFVVNCDFIGGFLGGEAAARDAGKTEEELIAGLDKLAKSPTGLPEPVRRHLEARLHLIFLHKEWTPTMIANGYIADCDALGGYIPENELPKAGPLNGIGT